MKKEEPGGLLSRSFGVRRLEKEPVSALSASCLVIYDGRLLREAARSRTVEHLLMELT